MIELTLRFRIVLAFVAIYTIWGSTYLGIRLAIQTVPPFLMAGIRFTLFPYTTLFRSRKSVV